MSVKFQTSLVCDGAACHAASPSVITDRAPTADAWKTLRSAAANNGWTRKHVNDRIGDYCPDCSSFLSNVPNYRAAS